MFLIINHYCYICTIIAIFVLFFHLYNFIPSFLVILTIDILFLNIINLIMQAKQRLIFTSRVNCFTFDIGDITQKLDSEESGRFLT